VDSKDVVPGIDVQGDGAFVGVQESFTAWDSKQRNLKLAIGTVWRNVEDNLVVQGQKLEGNEVTVAPVSVALMYGEKERDALQGMNFLTVEALHEFSGFLGSADEEEIKAQRAAAKEEYTVVHVQAARLQLLPFLSLGDKKYGNPMLFARVNGQWADGALIPAEQFGLGGDGSVRGYATREYLGDQGVSGTLEFRLPILLGLFDRKAGANDAPVDRLQLVAFCDVGWVKVEDPLPGEEDDKTLYGAGLGARLALTDHFQIKCDVAAPLEKTPDSDEVCVHFSGQVQF
jgi:hemolysin activation/secretion protein